MDMNDTLRIAIWQQFGAAIDMLENPLVACPDELWSDRSEHQQFWYVAHHALFFLDLYLTGSVEGFAPPAPFTLEELGPAGLPSDKPYTKDELHRYLVHCRQKCRATVEAITEERAAQLCQISWVKGSVLELHLYNMRHVQEHAAQLSLILGQKIGWEARWVFAAKI